MSRSSAGYVYSRSHDGLCEPASPKKSKSFCIFCAGQAGCPRGDDGHRRERVMTHQRRSMVRPRWMKFASFEEANWRSRMHCLRRELPPVRLASAPHAGPEGAEGGIADYLTLHRRAAAQEANMELELTVLWGRQARLLFPRALLRGNQKVVRKRKPCADSDLKLLKKLAPRAGLNRIELANRLHARRPPL